MGVDGGKRSSILGAETEFNYCFQCARIHGVCEPFAHIPFDETFFLQLFNFPATFLLILRILLCLFMSVYLCLCFSLSLRCSRLLTIYLDT